MKKVSVIFFIFFFEQHTHGQSPLINNLYQGRRNFYKDKIDSLEESLDKTSYFQFQTGYQNKVVFAGRNFSINQFGATLTSTYHHRSGVSLEYSGNYWSDESPNKYALTETGIYYERPLNDQFYVTAGYWHLFFHNGDEEDRNLFTNFFMLDESWYSSVGLFSLTYYFIKGSEDAHRLDISFSRSIDFYKLLGADKLSLEPSVSATFSTVNYFIFLSGVDESIDDNPNAFKVGNYEFSFPVIYRLLGKLEVNAAWHYAVPVSTAVEEYVHPVSYFTFEVSRILPLTKLHK